MKKVKPTLLAALCLCALAVHTATAQSVIVTTNSSGGLTYVTNVPTIQHGLEEVYAAIGSASNWVGTAYGLYAPALSKKIGGGVGYFYQVNEYVLAGARIDYVNGGFWMPSGNATFQLPLHPLKSFTWFPSWLSGLKVTPFAYVGIGVPISGAVIGNITVPGTSPTDNNGQATAIIGQGASLQVYAPTNGSWNISILGDRETWSGFDGTQYRFGLAFHKNF